MIRKLRSLNNEGFHLLVLAVALFALITIQEQQAYAGKSASDLGYANGRSDRLSNNQYNDYCDPNNTSSNPDLYCAAYKAGYFAGWNAAGVLYGNQQNSNNNNNNNNDDDNNDN